MRRQINRCIKCGNYIPHFHPERLEEEWYRNKLPKETKGDEFIWMVSSGDISCLEREWIYKIFDKIKELNHLQFFIQTKNPGFFKNWSFPENLMMGITLETDLDKLYKIYKISEAPLPSKRKKDFLQVNIPEKVVTIEPILKFNLKKLVSWVREIDPVRVYVGYDTKKCLLPEPFLKKTKRLMSELSEFTKVKPKLLREPHIKSLSITKYMEA
jgi:hypothetical protein